MKIIDASLHHINHETGVAELKDIARAGENLNEYVNKLLDEIATSSRKRDFRFRSPDTEVAAAIPQMFNGNFVVETDKIAARLLSKETDAQALMGHLNIEIQKGSLFQATIQLDDGTQQIIISKADHSTILDESDFRLHHGLPWNKKTFKAMAGAFENGIVDLVHVYDTNPQMTKYWWYEFLELQQIYDDAHNTKKSLDTLQSNLFDPIRQNSRQDYYVLRNTAINYFRTKAEFQMEDFIDAVLKDYQPYDQGLKVEKLITKARWFPEKYKFDGRFEISKDDVRKRMTQVFQLKANVELRLTQPVENLSDIVTRHRDNEGNPFVKISVDEAAFSQFPE